MKNKIEKILKKAFRGIINTFDDVFEGAMGCITILLSLIIYIGLFIVFPI